MLITSSKFRQQILYFFFPNLIYSQNFPILGKFPPVPVRKLHFQWVHPTLCPIRVRHENAGTLGICFNSMWTCVSARRHEQRNQIKRVIVFAYEFDEIIGRKRLNPPPTASLSSTLLQSTDARTSDARRLAPPPSVCHSNNFARCRSCCRHQMRTEIIESDLGQASLHRIGMRCKGRLTHTSTARNTQTQYARIPYCTITRDVGNDNDDDDVLFRFP